MNWSLPSYTCFCESFYNYPPPPFFLPKIGEGGGVVIVISSDIITGICKFRFFVIFTTVSLPKCTLTSTQNALGPVVKFKLRQRFLRQNYKLCKIFWLNIEKINTFVTYTRNCLIIAPPPPLLDKIFLEFTGEVNYQARTKTTFFWYLLNITSLFDIL